MGDADDPLLSDSRPFPGPVTDWAEWLAAGEEVDAERRLRECTHTGKPCGSRSFVERISELTGRRLWP